MLSEFRMIYGYHKRRWFLRRFVTTLASKSSLDRAPDNISIYIHHIHYHSHRRVSINVVVVGAGFVDILVDLLYFDDRLLDCWRQHSTPLQRPHAWLRILLFLLFLRWRSAEDSPRRQLSHSRRRHAVSHSVALLC